MANKKEKPVVKSESNATASIGEKNKTTPKNNKVKKKGQDLLRQKNLAKLLVEDRGKTPIGKLIKQAGYSDAYASNPQQLKKTLSWTELMEEHFPDSKIAEVEGKQLQASIIQNYVFSVLMTDEEIKEAIVKVPAANLIRIQRGPTTARAYFTTPDNTSIGKSLDRIYKLKGHYTADKNDNKLNETIEKMAEQLANGLP